MDRLLVNVQEMKLYDLYLGLGTSEKQIVIKSSQKDDFKLYQDELNSVYDQDNWML